MIDLLRGEFRCLAPDLPGFGHSRPPPPYDFSPSAQAAFLDGWLQETVGDEPILLVTHDIGAIMGMAWAALHLERVWGLLVMNTVVQGGYPWHPLARLWSTPVLGELFMLILSRPFYRLGFKRDFPQVRDAQIDRMYAGMTPVARRTILRYYRRMTRPDFFDGWETRLQVVPACVPTTVLWGAQNQLIPASCAESIGGSVKLLDGCGHSVPLEQPGRVADEVRALIASARALRKVPRSASGCSLRFRTARYAHQEAIAP